MSDTNKHALEPHFHCMCVRLMIRWTYVHPPPVACTLFNCITETASLDRLSNTVTLVDVVVYRWFCFGHANQLGAVINANQPDVQTLYMVIMEPTDRFPCVWTVNMIAFSVDLAMKRLMSLFICKAVSSSRASRSSTVIATTWVDSMMEPFVGLPCVCACMSNQLHSLGAENSHTDGKLCFCPMYI